MIKFLNMSLKVFNKKNVIIFLLLFFVFSKTAFAGDLKFNTNGGNFGIGTTTPSETLEIQNANTSGVTQTRLRITDIDTNDNPELQLQYTANKHWAIYVDKANNNALTVWNTNSMFTILASGNIGIATLTPEYKLDVNGIIRGNTLMATASVTTSLLFYQTDLTIQSGAGNIFLSPSSDKDVEVTQGILKAPVIKQNNIQVLDTLSSGNSAITVSGSNNSRTVTFKTCSSNETLVYNGTDWACIASGFIAKAGAGDGGAGIPFGGTLILNSINGISYGRSSNTITFGLTNTGVIAGTYPKVTVDTYGRITYGYSTINLTTDVSNILPIVNGGTNNNTFTSGQVTYYDGSKLTGNNNLYWDKTNNRLGINTSSPANALDVTGNISASGYISGTTI
ncbi:MAG TPA: hypothetical protein PLM63_01885, partial [bacterium]|nr:hypothetical protein [bacterium]